MSPYRRLKYALIIASWGAFTLFGVLLFVMSSAQLSSMVLTPPPKTIPVQVINSFDPDVAIYPFNEIAVSGGDCIDMEIQRGTRGGKEYYILHRDASGWVVLAWLVFSENAVDSFRARYGTCEVVPVYGMLTNSSFYSWMELQMKASPQAKSAGSPESRKFPEAKPALETRQEQRSGMRWTHFWIIIIGVLIVWAGGSRIRQTRFLWALEEKG